MIDIFKKIETDFIHFTNSKFTGMMAILGVTFASRLHEFVDKLRFMEKQIFTSTADKEYLYKHGGMLLPPLIAQRAKGTILVKGLYGITIPINTIFTSNAHEYLTTSEVVIAENGEVVVDVIAKEGGVEYNKLLDTDIKLKVVIGGVNSSSVILIHGGTDDEDTESYRQRIKEFLTQPQTPFNKSNIINTIKSLNKTIKYVWVKGGEIERGKVKIYTINHNNELSQQDITDVTDIVLAIKPPQLHDDDITIVAPNKTNVDIIITSVVPSDTRFFKAIEDNIKELFLQDNFEKTVTNKDIDLAINAVNVQGSKVISYTITSGEVLRESKSIQVLSSIEVS